MSNIRVLTKEAQEDRDSFDNYAEYYCCSCHISPPCTYCTHPGNPLNQEEDEDAWEYVEQNRREPNDD